MNKVEEDLSYGPQDESRITYWGGLDKQVWVDHDFKIGDLVQYVGVNEKYLKSGMVGRVKSYGGENKIEFGMDGNAWFVNASDLIHASPKTFIRDGKEWESSSYVGNSMEGYPLTDVPKDPINPDYYKLGLPCESIDYQLAVCARVPAKEAPLLFNVLKYTTRYHLKNGLEDLKKTKWYLEKLIKEVEARK